MSIKKMETQTNKEKLNKFVNHVFSTTADFGGMSGWIHTVQSKDQCFFIEVEDCHFAEPIKQVTVNKVKLLGYGYDGEPYGGYCYKLTKENYAWGICKWIAIKKYNDIVTDYQVMKMILEGVINLDHIDFDCGDAFDMTQYAMLGEVPFG
tara:strand:- start:66 stop:515 length:450 start_codon:yes stop_codon:yes gene_type:complete